MTDAVLSHPAPAPVAVTTAPSDVLLVSLYFHPEPAGSAPPVSDLAWWLAEQGHRPRVVTARPHYPQGAIFDGYRRGARDREVERGVAIRRFATYVSGGGGLLGRLATETTFALQLLRGRLTGAVMAAPYVLSVCPSIFNVLLAPIYRRRGGRLVVIVHDIQSGLGAALSLGLGGVLLRGFRVVERFALNRADAIVTLSDKMADTLRELGVTRPITVLPPQIDSGEFDPAPAPPVTANKVLYSGNFGRKQGLDQVLRAAAELERRGSAAAFVLRGDGNQREQLRALACELGLANVTFEPLVDRADIAVAYAAAAIHLIPQRPDGGEFAVPSKAFSIMAAARPFVCTAFAGSSLAELARTTGAGIAVPPDDPAAFADAIEALIADPERGRQMGERGRAYVARHVDRQVVCAGMLELLRAPA
jgi:colanic acid biosynthesis glycosyl transferase WcaI